MTAARKFDAQQWGAPPTDYELITPDGWFQLFLDPEQRDKGIIALADRQFRGVDNAPHLKEQFMRELQRKAKEAFKVGGVELYLSTLAVGPLPLSSSLLVSFPDPASGPGNVSPHELADRFGRTGADARGGRVVCRRYRGAGTTEGSAVARKPAGQHS